MLRSAQVIDLDGYRPNVGSILCNDRGRLLWARRIGQDAWQFPQGGIRCEETPEQALFRELSEELGLLPEHVDVHLSLSANPDFVDWRCVSYWYPVRNVVPFKRRVYARALRELAPLLKMEVKATVPDRIASGEYDALVR